MWLFLPFGFVSVVHKGEDAPGVLCVRARDAGSLDNLRERCPALGATLEGGGTDYPFRAYVDGAAFGSFLAEFVADLDFSNFKAQTTAQHSRAYHDVCMSVWGTMHRLSLAEIHGRDPTAWRRNDGVPVFYRRWSRRDP